MSYNNKRKKKDDLRNLPVIRLFLRILMVLVIFSASRWMIYLFNTEFFHHLSLAEALRLYFRGMRFDLVTIAYVNIPVIFFFCLPSKIIYNKILHKIIDIYFIVANSMIIVLNMIDVIYFRFIGTRMTSRFFQSFGNSNENFGSIAGQVITDYWFMLLMMILFVLILAVGANRSQLKKGDETLKHRWYIMQWVSLTVCSLLTILACRGGFQEKPIDTETALDYADSQNVPVVLNTPFNLVKAPALKEFEEIHLFKLEEMDFSPIHYTTKANRFVSDSLEYQPNLVFIVLESYGQEMIGYYNPDRRYQLTPFLDSLLTQSLTFDGRANGRRSFEALPALLSGIPSLMEVDFMSSPYHDNQVDGLGLSLKPLGYHTSMFHGGNNGSMNFDAYAHRTGFDHYFGRKEYNNDDDFDGRLGIYDGPFLQYCIHSIDSLPQPFATVIYTLSSHYPYRLPKGFDMPEESYLWSGFEKTVYYTDFALRDFFEAASKEPWFDSTLFVITADHANTEHYLSNYSNVWGMYSVPIAFYMPSQIKARRCTEIAQHIDLNVSILSALGVDDTVFSFGRNIFDSSSDSTCIAYINQTYQFSDGQYLLQSDGKNTIGVFNIRDDRQLNDNLYGRIHCSDLARKLQERIQEYNNRFIHNQLYIDKEALHEQAKDTIHPQSDFGQDPQEEPVGAD